MQKMIDILLKKLEGFFYECRDLAHLDEECWRIPGMEHALSIVRRLMGWLLSMSFLSIVPGLTIWVLTTTIDFSMKEGTIGTLIFEVLITAVVATVVLIVFLLTTFMPALIFIDDKEAAKATRTMFNLYRIVVLLSPILWMLPVYDRLSACGIYGMLLGFVMELCCIMATILVPLCWRLRVKWAAMRKAENDDRISSTK